ncbi:L-lactate dehydrogenase [Corynebacterium incognita]|uniref:L-lactate dehydrogenase n=1 Tax=Corynebacterium incognita TaxID=2754725 RepID=A0A7G7CRT3_9CORY|nr:L-lactate dehydrogenase [Corynebacterium incognita]QNE90299.1 L-lactate dehydrogenase [Corynebacterium incognita]
MPKPLKLAIVGMGHVGSHVLADAASMNIFGEIVCIDINKDVAFGEALDQYHATGIPGAVNTTITSAGWEGLSGADIVIVTAGDSIQKSDDDELPDRAGLVKITGNVTRSVMGEIVKHADTEPAVIFVTNPADTIVWIAQNEFDYPENKVFGTGTMLDTARLRRYVGTELNVSPQSVEGLMIGEHGLSAVPVLSGLRVGWSPVGDQFVPEEVADAVIKSAYELINAKGWTDAGVSACALSLARAVLFDERVIYPVATTLRGEHGHDGDVAISVPCLVGKDGAEKRYELELNEWETKALEKSIEAVQAAMANAGCR